MPARDAPRPLSSAAAARPRDTRCAARARGWHRRTEDAVVARLRELARALPDHKVTERLDAEGLRTRTGKAWTYARVHSIRRQHGIATACPPHTREAARRADRLMPVAAAARRLGVSSSLVYVWLRQGVLAYDGMEASR